MSDARAQKAIDAAFRHHGVDAWYTPAGGEGRTIRVLFKHPDVIADVIGTRHFGPAQLIELRKSEVSSPKKGDGIVIDGKSYRLDQPTQPDDRRLKWRAGLNPA